MLPKKEYMITTRSDRQTDRLLFKKRSRSRPGYRAGSVEDGNVKENAGIRADICNILEGGSYAFEKRERKYGIQELA